MTILIISQKNFTRLPNHFKQNIVIKEKRISRGGIFQSGVKILVLNVERLQKSQILSLTKFLLIKEIKFYYG